MEENATIEPSSSPQEGKAKTIEKSAERFGLLAAAALVVFFLLMRVVGLAHVVELRMLNFFILGYAVYLANRHFKKDNVEAYTYMKGLGLGVLTSIFASLVFALFMFIYVQFLEPAFMDSIRENEAMGRFLNPYIVAVAVAVEGVASGLILAFILVNYMKPTRTM